MEDEIRKHFDKIAPKYDYYKQRQKFYYDNLKRLYASIIPPKKKVLELGCRTGDLLASLKPSIGVGVDISSKMVKIAQHKYPKLKFLVSSVENLKLNGKFDFVVMADLVEHLSDVYAALKNIRKNCKKNTKLVITSINPFWTIPLHIMEWLKLKMPEGPHNWISHDDLENMLRLLNYKILMRKRALYSLVQVLIAQPDYKKYKEKNLSVSIIIPAYNEEANIAKCISRIPNFGKELEIIVVDDGSNDKTARKVSKIARKDNRVKLISYKPNRGKGWAVKCGFDAATKDVLMILDADMAVPPEELPRFLEPIKQGKAEFVNGSRLLYPIEPGAMTDLHMFGNKIFGKIFSWLLGQRITDTLCGTKAFLRKYYGKKIKLVEKSWPDFDMLFGAGASGMKIVEVPVHYKRRLYGISKMKTYKHGLLLGLMCLKGFWKLKILRILGI